MYVAVVPNRNSPPAVLLRESFRENGKVHNRTIANLSHWDPAKVDALRAVNSEYPARTRPSSTPQVISTNERALLICEGLRHEGASDL